CARRPHENTSDDKQLIPKRETCKRSSQPCQRIQDRDDDRHVPAANGQHEEDTKKQCETGEHPDVAHITSACDYHRSKPKNSQCNQSVHKLLTGEEHWFATQQLLELSKCDNASSQ